MVKMKRFSSSSEHKKLDWLSRSGSLLEFYNIWNEVVAKNLSVLSDSDGGVLNRQKTIAASKPHAALISYRIVFVKLNQDPALQEQEEGK